MECYFERKITTNHVMIVDIKQEVYRKGMEVGTLRSGNRK